MGAESWRGHIGLRALKRVLPLIVLMVGLLVSGCVDTRDIPSSIDLESSIREYNRLLIEGFAQLDMGVLEPIATQDQAEREFAYMTALGEGRMRLEATLVDIEFGTSNSGESTATVETRETWGYRRLSIDTGELIAEEIAVEYHLQYTLIPVNGRWVVANIESLDESDLLPSSGE